VNTADLSTLTLSKGDHSPGEAMCLLEAVAFVAREPWSDHPACVCPVLGAFGRNLNDVLPDAKRQRLVPLIPQLIGTAGDGLAETRSYMALDWLIRTYTPAWLDLAGLTAEAQTLRDLRRIVDLSAAQSAGSVVREAQKKSDAAWAAARDAAWDAARAAARAAAGAAARAAGGAAGGDAARDAARAAAWDAAWDAAWAAAWDAARAAGGAAGGDAARDAARAALKPKVDQLQDSAIDLYAAMIGGAA
jgi:hypothetical protein